MIRITVTEKHPITVIANGEPRYHFAQIIGVSASTIQLQLRRRSSRPNEVRASGLFVETFAQISTARFGTVSIEIDARNVSRRTDDLLLVHPIAAHALQVIVSPLPIE